MAVRAESGRDAEGAVAGRPRRGWLSGVLVAAVVPFAVWALLRASGWEPAFRWKQLVAFTPYVAAASVAVPLVALVLRRWYVATAALVPAVMLVATVAPRAFPDDAPAAKGPAVRVLAANLLQGSAPAAEVMDLVRRVRPDVLALQEITPEAAGALDGAGIGRSLPHRVVRAEPGVTGSAVYARYPLQEQPIIHIGFGQARARVAVPGAPPVEVVSVHPCAPTYPENEACWEAGLRALPAADTGGPVRILAGDFNATLDHAEMRRILSTGYRDAADATGQGLRATWPDGAGGRDLPGVALDRVVADRRVAVRGFGVHPLPMTDHRAVHAELVLPGR
ncbi:endonuclease/exonuclease/phosphatase family protein [Actinomadura sp. 21ATH]|uniref:endonuclease/exonuclease/phosphatase family protein n=1 Tax=Actinomadura sp. 21ATH TaxID=1735444 RepID=UPI0035C07F59